MAWHCIAYSLYRITSYYCCSIWIFSATRAMMVLVILLQTAAAGTAAVQQYNNTDLKNSTFFFLFVMPFFCPVDEAWGCNPRRTQAARRHFPVSLPRRLLDVQIGAVRLLPVLGRLLAGARRAKRRKVPQFLDMVHRYSL